MDFGKLYCNIHPQEQITNFCNKNQCLMGLCANCICTHTQHHIDKGTTPGYQNIRQTYKKIQDTLRIQTQLFQQDKQRLENIKNKIHQKRLKIRQTIDLAKQQVLTVLGGYFDEKQKKMLIQIQTQQKKYGLHSINRLDALNSFITRQTSNLIYSSQQLTTNNFLQSLPRIRHQYLTNSQKLHHQIKNQIQLNQKFNTTISFNKNLMPQLSNIMENAITLQFTGMTYNSQFNKQNYIRRPASQGKTITRTYSCQTIDPLLSYIKDKNISINMNRESHCLHQNQNELNNSKQLDQVQNTYQFVQIQSSQSNTKKQLQPSLQKISVSQKHFKQISESLPHRQSSNSVPYLHFSRLNRQSNISQNVSLQDKIITNRDCSQIMDQPNFDHSQNSKINSNLVIFNSNFQIAPPLLQKNIENAIGISKKSKKSGLKLVAPHEFQSRNIRTQNVQNYRLPSDRLLQ